MRAYPALDVTWAAHPGAAVIDRLLAILDDYRPVAVEDLPNGARVFFAASTLRDSAAAVVESSALRAKCVVLDVPDENWAARSQASLGPVRVGNLVVTPPWAAADLARSSDEDTSTASVIIIRPAMGFGSGHHASTRLALALLQRAPVAGANVVDAGTGSGVLALAAWRLGAATAIGFDHDTDALGSARESVELNPGADAVTLLELEISDSAAELGPCDVVTANLTGDLIVRSAGTLSSLVRRDGRLVLSGILSEESAAVVTAFTALGWDVVERVEEDEWTGLMLRRTTSPSESTAS